MKGISAVSFTGAGFMSFLLVTSIDGGHDALTFAALIAAVALFALGAVTSRSK